MGLFWSLEMILGVLDGFIEFLIDEKEKEKMIKSVVKSFSKRIEKTIQMFDEEKDKMNKRPGRSSLAEFSRMQAKIVQLFVS